MHWRSRQQLGILSKSFSFMLLRYFLHSITDSGNSILLYLTFTIGFQELFLTSVLTYDHNFTISLFHSSETIVRKFY